MFIAVGTKHRCRHHDRWQDHPRPCGHHGCDRLARWTGRTTKRIDSAATSVLHPVSIAGSCSTRMARTSTGRRMKLPKASERRYAQYADIAQPFHDRQSARRHSPRSGGSRCVVVRLVSRQRRHRLHPCCDRAGRRDARAHVRSRRRACCATRRAFHLRLRHRSSPATPCGWTSRCATGAWVRRWHGRHGRQRRSSRAWFPAIGYQRERELILPAAARLGLPERPVVPRLEDAPSLVMNRAPGTMLDVVISTAEGQTGVASGALRRSWDEWAQL